MSDAISESVQDRHIYNGRLIRNHIRTIKWHDCHWPWVSVKNTFAVQNLYITHTL